jgi:EAL domain-containing protein (putative c-di-GMP-specific phosphodiesterase class I)
VPGAASPGRRRLSSLGVQSSVDDFGTGYGSLAYLKRLPISEVKIDKSFVLGMEHDNEQLAIVSSIVDLGLNLGLRVVAEGVETQRAWSILRERGCHRAQGYFLTPPLPPDEMARWVEEHERALDAATGPVPPVYRSAAREVARVEAALRAQVGVDELT